MYIRKMSNVSENSTPQAKCNSSAVLLLEDDAKIREIFKFAIEPLGYDVITSSNADDFKQAVRHSVARMHRQYDRLVCFLDIFVPGNGVQVFSFLKAEFPFVPVVFCSGSADIPMAVDLMKSGANDFLQKPFSLGQLIEAVESALTSFETRYKDHQLREHAVDVFESLSKREREFLQIHLSMPEADMGTVAKNLGITRRTAETHRASVNSKLMTHFSTLEQFVLVYGRNSILEPD
jgi:two-component system response regulator FixJ